MVLLLILASTMIGMQGCKKSEGSSSPNPFGPPPKVSQASITKVSKHFDCTSAVDLCCVDPPACTCCCFKTVDQTVADLDLVMVSVKVEDPDGLSNILVSLVTFLDPPKSSPASGTGTSQINLELWDTGTTPIGTQVTGDGGVYPILSGDATGGDGIYTRNFYMLAIGAGTVNPGNCIQNTDTPQLGGTFSIYSSSAPFPATKILNFEFFAQAVDRAGNISKSTTITLPIAESQLLLNKGPAPCGPPCP
jgi:hypothetical protein